MPPRSSEAPSRTTAVRVAKMVVRDGCRIVLTAALAAGVQGCPLAVGYLGAGNGDDSSTVVAGDSSADDALGTGTDTGTADESVNVSAIADVGSPEGGADVAADASVSTNIIANPSCASGTSPWYTFGANGGTPTLIATTAFSADGGSSCWVSNRQASFQGPTQDIQTSLVPGQTYALSAQVMVRASGDADASGTVEAQVQITVVYSCQVDGAASDPIYLQLASTTATDSTWTLMTGSLTAPTCPLGGAFIFYFEGPPSGVDLLVQDVSLAP